MRDWSKHVTWPITPQLKLGNIREYSPNYFVEKNIWKIITTITCIWGKKKLGYLSLDIICSSKLTVFLQLRSRKTVCFLEQIRSADWCSSIFSRQMEACFIYYRIFESKCVAKDIWRLTNTIASIWRENILVYLYNNMTCSLKLLGNCLLVRTDNVRWQICKHIFVANGGYCILTIILISSWSFLDMVKQQSLHLALLCLVLIVSFRHCLHMSSKLACAVSRWLTAAMTKGWFS